MAKAARLLVGPGPRKFFALFFILLVLAEPGGKGLPAAGLTERLEDLSGLRSSTFALEMKKIFSRRVAAIMSRRLLYPPEKIYNLRHHLRAWRETWFTDEVRLEVRDQMIVWNCPASPASPGGGGRARVEFSRPFTPDYQWLGRLDRFLRAGRICWPHFLQDRARKDFNKFFDLPDGPLVSAGSPPKSGSPSGAQNTEVFNLLLFSWLRSMQDDQVLGRDGRGIRFLNRREPWPRGLIHLEKWEKGVDWQLDWGRTPGFGSAESAGKSALWIRFRPRQASDGNKSWRESLLDLAVEVVQGFAAGQTAGEGKTGGQILLLDTRDTRGLDNLRVPMVAGHFFSDSTVKLAEIKGRENNPARPARGTWRKLWLTDILNWRRAEAAIQPLSALLTDYPADNRDWRRALFLLRRWAAEFSQCAILAGPETSSAMLLAVKLGQLRRGCALHGQDPGQGPLLFYQRLQLGESVFLGRAMDWNAPRSGILKEWTDQFPLNLDMALPVGWLTHPDGQFLDRSDFQVERELPAGISTAAWAAQLAL